MPAKSVDSLMRQGTLSSHVNGKMLILLIGAWLQLKMATRNGGISTRPVRWLSHANIKTLIGFMTVAWPQSKMKMGNMVSSTRQERLSSPLYGKILSVSIILAWPKS